ACTDDIRAGVAVMSGPTYRCSIAVACLLLGMSPVATCSGADTDGVEGVKVTYRDCKTDPNDPKKAAGTGPFTFLVAVRAQDVYLTGEILRDFGHCAADEPAPCRRSCAVTDETHWECLRPTPALDPNDKQEWDAGITANGDDLTWWRRPAALRDSAD